MEKTTNQKIRLGIFVLLGTLFFITAVYFIGNKQNMFRTTTTINATFRNINGLQPGNNIRFSGINVGTVKEIIIENDSTIKVTMMIEEQVVPFIKKDAVASIGTDGLVGNMVVKIALGKQSTVAVKEGDKILSEDRMFTEKVMQTLNSSTENIKTITDNLAKITNQINQGKGTIGMLLKDTIVSQDFKQTIHYLKITSKSASQSIANLNAIISDLNHKNNVVAVLKDTAVANNIKYTIAHLEKSSEQIHNVVTNLNSTITNIKDGKGAINYLSNDPKLVQKIDTTITTINKASQNLNENLEALKHNFLLRGYFKKQAKAKAKADKAKLN